MDKQSVVRWAHVSTPEDRKKARMTQWQGGVTLAGNKDRFEREFWANASAEVRLSAVFTMAEQWWLTQNPNAPPLRLDRSVGGLRKSQG